MAAEEITISELELADEVLADMTLPVDTATETRAVTLKQLRAWLGSALPIGSIFASVGRLDDERFTLLDGKTISRIGTYEAFCNKVVEKVQAGTWKACTEEEFNLEVSETGQCGKFVVSNDYVRIPKFGNSLCSGVIDGKIPVVGNGQVVHLTDGTNTSWLNGYNAENNHLLTHSNLPNNPTLGTIANFGGTYVNGALGISQDATKSGIEGKINSIEVFYYMVVSTKGQTANVEIDINKVYEDFNLKANSDLSNVASVASSFKEASVGWGMPDYSAGVYVGNLPYTAPCDGYINTHIVHNAGDVSLYVNGVEISLVGGGASAGLDYLFPVSKGDVITSSSTRAFYANDFYPCKGVN